MYQKNRYNRSMYIENVLIIVDFSCHFLCNSMYSIHTHFILPILAPYIIS